MDGPVLALFASLFAEQRSRLRRLRGLCTLRPSALSLLPSMQKRRGIQLAFLLALLASLGGCLTQVALDQMEYPSVTFEQPHHAWLNADGETISVVVSAAHTEGERLYTLDLPQAHDFFGACPAVVRYRYDPDEKTLRVVSWDRPVFDEHGRLCWKDPSELVMPADAHPVRIDGDRLVRHGSSPRFLLEKGPETRQKVAAGVFLPFAVVLDVALAPVYGVGFVFMKLFF